MAITHKAIDHSVRKLRDFKEVNREKTSVEKHESLDILASTFGLDIDYLIAVSSTFYEEAGFVVVGVLIGLFAAEYEREHETSNRPTDL